MYAPTLLAHELTSIARKKVLESSQAKEQLVANLQDGLALDVRWQDVDHFEVLDLALALSLTTYDASYLYPARTSSNAPADLR